MFHWTDLRKHGSEGLCNDFTQFCPCVYGEFVGAAHVKTVKDLIYHATDMELSTIQGNPQVWSESSLFAS